MSVATVARPATHRFVFLAPAGIALLAGLDAALILVGLPAPVTTARLPEVHGMLLVLGFVGTLIALERAVALGRPAGYAAPALLGAGGLLLVSPAPLLLGRLVLLLGTAGLVALYVPLWRRQRDPSVLAQALGAVLTVGAVVHWLGGVPVSGLLPWLVGFVVLTIAGERVELARVTMPAGAERAFLPLCWAVMVAAPATSLWPSWGYPLLGAALLALVGWLVRHDIARRTIRGVGLPRYMAGCMLAAYAWLAVAGSVWLVGGAAYEGTAYDAVVHAVFLGFTLSMILGHAPMILPAVLRRPMPYHPAFLVPAVLLHLSLLVRIWVGDAQGVQLAWETGAALNIVAVLLFVATALWSAATRPPDRTTQRRSP